MRLLVRLPRAARTVSEDLARVTPPGIFESSVALRPPAHFLGAALELHAPGAVSGVLMEIASPAVINCSVSIPLDIEPIDAAISAPTIEGMVFLPQHRAKPSRKPSLSERPHHKQPTDAQKARASAALFTALRDLLFPPARDELFDLKLPHRLYKFQSEGVQWLLQHTPGALLADDMGLGKTVQAIVAMRLLFRQRKITNALVVAPKSVQTSWELHFADWAPELRVRTLAGNPYSRAMTWTALASRTIHVGVITYESFMRDFEDGTARLDLGLLVADETQRIKNPGTKTHRALSNMTPQRRWGLTGTPLENRLEELSTILYFLSRDPQLLPFVRSRMTGRRRQQLADWCGPTVRNVAERIMLRRRKTQVLEDLPKLTSHVEFIELGSRQRRAYERAEKEGVARLRRGEVRITNVLSLITRLKQLCNGASGENAKLDWLIDYIENAVEHGDKTLIFSQFVDTLHDIEPKLARYAPLKYTGRMSGRQRDQVIRTFQSDSRRRAMLVSLRAGGTGLTLTAANRVVHFDAWWNPAVMSQATARTHRIGQAKGVFETTLVAVNTVEERIQRILESKRALFKEYVDDLSTNSLPRMLTEAEIFGLFGLEVPRHRRSRARRAARPAAVDTAHRRPARSRSQRPWRSPSRGSG